MSKPDDFEEIMGLPIEVLRERYWNQRSWIRSYAHCLDGLLGVGTDYTGLLPVEIRRHFKARAQVSEDCSHG